MADCCCFPCSSQFIQNDIQMIVFFSPNKSVVSAFQPVYKFS